MYRKEMSNAITTTNEVNNNAIAIMSPLKSYDGFCDTRYVS